MMMAAKGRPPPRRPLPDAAQARAITGGAAPVVRAHLERRADAPCPRAPRGTVEVGLGVRLLGGGALQEAASGHELPPRLLEGGAGVRMHTVIIHHHPSSSASSHPPRFSTPQLGSLEGSTPPRARAAPPWPRLRRPRARSPARCCAGGDGREAKQTEGGGVPEQRLGSGCATEQKGSPRPLPSLLRSAYTIVVSLLRLFSPCFFFL